MRILSRRSSFSSGGGSTAGELGRRLRLGFISRL
jgi:hypothetical protein